MEQALLVVYWVVPIAVAIYLAMDASARGRSPIGWGFVGLLLGPLGLIIWLVKRPPRPGLGLAARFGQPSAGQQQAGVYIPLAQKRVKKDGTFWGILAVGCFPCAAIIIGLFTVDSGMIMGLLGFAGFLLFCVVTVVLLNRQTVHVCPACKALVHEGKISPSSLRLYLGPKCPVCGVKFWADGNQDAQQARGELQNGARGRDPF